MELAFQTIRLREICEIDEFARKELGNSVAKVLQNRLSDIISVNSIFELPFGNPKLLMHSDYCEIDLIDSYRLTLVANHVKNPLDKSGNIDWSQVTRIKILKIEKQ